MIKIRFPSINNIMSTPSKAFTLYKNNTQLKNKAEEIVNAIIVSNPEYFVDAPTFPEKFRTCPEWAIKPYFMDAIIPEVITEYKTVTALEITDILLNNDKYEKIADASTQNASQAVREACLKALKLFGNGRVFDYQNGNELAMVEAVLNTMLASNLIDETTKNQILNLGTKQVTIYKSWTDNYNEGKADEDKLFFVIDPQNPGQHPFDREWVEFKLYWYPINN